MENRRRDLWRKIEFNKKSLEDINQNGDLVSIIKKG